MSEINFNMDQQASSFCWGNVQNLKKYKDSEVTTLINFYLPSRLSSKIKRGTYTYKQSGIKIKVIDIIQPEKDIIFNLTKNMNFGVSLKELNIDELPFKVFSDNLGQYPTTQVFIELPYLLAKWFDKYEKTGFRKQDIEKTNITGLVENETKIEFLKLIKIWLKQLGINEFIKYEEISFFCERFFNNKNEEILTIVNTLTHKDSYKNSIKKYILDSNVIKDINQFDTNKKEICSEEDLLDIVKLFTEDCIKHHVENRRWIEPFWNDGLDKERVKSIPKRETKIQPTLHVMYLEGLEKLGINIVRETDEGVGLLDFKFTHTNKNGKSLCVCVEFKLAHNKKIQKGINSQLPQYLKANRTKNGIYVVMWFKDSKGYFNEPKDREKHEMDNFLIQETKKINEKEHLNLDYVMIDASKKDSASK